MFLSPTGYVETRVTREPTKNNRKVPAGGGEQKVKTKIEDAKGAFFFVVALRSSHAVSPAPATTPLLTQPSLLLSIAESGVARDGHCIDSSMLFIAHPPLIPLQP